MTEKPMIEWLKSKHFVRDGDDEWQPWGYCWSTREGMEHLSLLFFPMNRHMNDSGLLAAVRLHASGTHPTLQIGTCETLEDVQRTAEAIRLINGYKRPEGEAATPLHAQLSQMESQIESSRDTETSNIENFQRWKTAEAQLTAAEARCHQLQDAYDALTGEKFSDRVHTALKSRAEVAEAAVANLRSVLNARIELWNSSAGSMRDKWRSECADELAALLEKR